jgi:hypothetical protein
MIWRRKLLGLWISLSAGAEAGAAGEGVVMGRF